MNEDHLNETQVDGIPFRMIKGKRYNWKSQKERLVYLGYVWSGSGFWHQFSKVEEPDVLWCECKDYDLKNIEITR